MEEIRTILLDMPTTIKAYTIANADMTFTICLNARLSSEQRYKSYQHEIKHIKNGDFKPYGNVGLIEISAHNI